ncbi:MAG: transcriptional regulator [Candidatus Heimdallarchaeota archaeon]|nr:transcriptional regulator [Candidatus Heimdallarchaeota archaeon]
MSDSSDFKRIVNINELIHSPVRLAILLLLMSRPIATFPEVKLALDVTAGNLSSHIKRLEAANLIVTSKEFINAKPTTQLVITPEGMNAVIEYKKLLQGMLDNYTT